MGPLSSSVCPTTLTVDLLKKAPPSSGEEHSRSGGRRSGQGQGGQGRGWASGVVEAAGGVGVAVGVVAGVEVAWWQRRRRRRRGGGGRRWERRRLGGGGMVEAAVVEEVELVGVVPPRPRGGPAAGAAGAARGTGAGGVVGAGSATGGAGAVRAVSGVAARPRPYFCSAPFSRFLVFLLP
ncbi:unnamed protein product [Closterium sp. NIES-64]|nr:unnamed protein product [Closterium sp. NIES-64]